MDETTQPTPSKLESTLTNLAYSPVKLRALLTLLLVGAWYAGFAMPRTDEIDASTRLVQKERGRLDLAKQVERLRKQVARFQARIPKDPDPNEWAQYMLSGSREFGLKVANLETPGRKDAGPYKALMMKMDVEGSFPEVDGFLRWIESNPRLLRIDSLAIAPLHEGKATQGKIKASMVILGIS
jgi:Tfp pilus assembly protein PilO